ncbi:hypothetical protein ACGFNX_14075 [Streptomyces sp. NPDC048723]|uniref:hypothetical protein n=1 Tax=Streptomyces sp. NPDC048723 TaxID=3365589 RepID=UPI0037129026
MFDVTTLSRHIGGWSASMPKEAQLVLLAPDLACGSATANAARRDRAIRYTTPTPVRGTSLGQVLPGPNAFAIAEVARAPALAGGGDELQATTALVGVGGAADARGGEAAVVDLADQGVAAQQAQADGAFGVPDHVADQLADQQFGGERQVVQPPGGQLSADVMAGLPGSLGIVGKATGGDVGGGGAPGVGDEQCRVVIGLLAVGQ